MARPGPQHETELTQRLRLLEAELPFLRRALLRHAIPPADAEDVAQDTVLVAARRWADYDPARPLRPWLLGIAFRVAHDHRRRRRDLREHADTPDPRLTPEEELQASRERDRLAEALASLPEKHRIPVVMYELQGLSLKQMAARWSVSVSAASARLKAGRRALARSMRRQQALEPERRRAFWWAALPAAAAVAFVAARKPAPAVAREPEARVVARWSFDEPGRIGRDSSGGGHDCAARELLGVPAAGVAGGALALSGKGWLACANGETLATRAFTVAAWARPSPHRAVMTVLARQLGRGNRDDLFLGFIDDRVLFNSDRWRVRLEHLLSRAPVRWIHLAVTSDGQTSRLFVDGALVDETTVEPAAEGGDAPLLIGGGFNGAAPAVNERFVGAIDELTIYDRAIPPAQVARLAER
jgi:RNA polymerase sigma-70 factor, ECF subfamily